MLDSVELEHIRVAAGRISPLLHHTPVLTSRSLDVISGRQLFFKCESLQRTGSFKVRGALNAILSLGPEIDDRGVLTASSGNFAQGLAWAARYRGIAAHVVMPVDAPSVKIASAKAFGAMVYPCDSDLMDRDRVCDEIRDATGATFVSPHDHRDVIAGQGTIALELLHQVAELDAIIAPIGGGGLIGGIAVAAKTLRPAIRVIGAEPIGAADAARSKEQGHLVTEPNPRSVAEGLLVGLSEMTWCIVRDLVDEVILVDDDATIRAMRLIWERGKIIVEPSAAVAVAAVLSPQFRRHTQLSRVGVVLSGGNVDLADLPWMRKDLSWPDSSAPFGEEGH